jgi:quinoprotein glucose dehydrogenase
MFMVTRLLTLVFLLFLAACNQDNAIDYSGPTAGWDETTGSKGGGQYSALTQIDRNNVQRLKLAWTWSSSDGVPGQDPKLAAASGIHSSATVEATPIIANGKLITCTPNHRVVALDPGTGKELWNYDPDMNPDVPSHVCRGVTQWREAQPQEGKVCQGRILFTSGDGRLIAIDPKDGKPCDGFGDHGVVDMKKSLGSVGVTDYYQTSPPMVFKDMVIAGSGFRGIFRKNMTSGVVRAWNVRTGKLVWAFDMVGPAMKPVTADDAASGKEFTRGTPKVWSYMSADLDHGLIYLPTGNAPADHFKGPPRDVDTYGSSVVALDAASGKVAWSFQAVHHDLWDYDTPAQPVLYEHEGKIPALALSTKMGHVFLLNRLTGKPIFPVEERPVPQTDVPGEWTSPTQPFPTLPKPLSPPKTTADELIGAPYYSAGCKESLEALRNEGIFTPPSIKGSLVRPGYTGGMNWGSGSINPHTHTFVTTLLDMPFVIKLTPRTDDKRAEDDHTLNWVDVPQYETPYKARRMPLLSKHMIPCFKPPWGSIVAIDLNSGLEKWRKPLGSMRNYVPIIGRFLDVGVPVIGGNLQTASGLIFVGASADRTLRAIDSETGKELWSAELPFSAHATPMTYRLIKGGKQYLVVSAGGSKATGEANTGNSMVAFALPD